MIPNFEQPPVVLLVDDEEDFREEFAVLLSRRGCEVTTAANAASALRELESNPRIELLMTDLRMPGMDGLALIDQVQRGRNRRDCVGFILVTGHGDFLNLKSVIEGPGMALMHKPVEVPAFMAQMASLLAHVRRERDTPEFAPFCRD